MLVGGFTKYRPCRRDASTVYDIENIRHDVVYAQTPLNMNDPFDSMIGFSAEKIYSECTTMVLDAMDLAGANKVIISMLLQYHAFGKMAQLISYIKKQGIRFKYPEGWRDAGTPLVILKQKRDQYLYFRSLDTQVREKTFTFVSKKEKLYAELIFEEAATLMSNTICVPTWEIGYSGSVETISAKHCAHIQAAYDLRSWETREDVPEWAHEVSLIAAIHAQHWTGYIFNDYEQILRNIQALCEKIEPKRILAFLPGWGGRYYWKYGNYGPDERMGGEEGFHHLCNSARALGVHIMPMFGIDIVGVHHAGFAEWGEPCELRTASGNFSRASVGWDGSRHYDHSSNRTLNPAALKWQNRLVQQITSLADEYGFDAAFLDIAAVWANDPNHNVYEGVCRLAKRLRENHPNMLLAGEGWYDGLMSCIPLLQCGHTDGKLHWHDDAYAPMLDTFARNFGHLCLGDPSRNSTASMNKVLIQSGGPHCGKG